MTPSPPARSGDLAIAAAVLTAVALFFAPALAGGGQFLYRDAGRSYYPEKRWIAEELRRGHFPEWNPYAGLGTPVVAGAIAAVQHPLNVLFVLLPFDAAFRLWVVLCYALAGLGAVVWLRSLGRAPAAAAVAGLAFALSGFLVSSSDNLIHLATMAGAPWLLAATHAHAARGGRLRLAAVLAASFLCAAGGEMLDWGIALLLATAQAWVLPPDDVPPARRAVRTLASLGAALAGAAPVLLPFAAFLPESSRAGDMTLEEARRWNLHPLRLAELAVPHLARGVFGKIRNEAYLALTGDRMPTPWTLSLYAGAPVVALACLGAARVRAARALLLAAALLAWVSMGHRAGFGAIAARLPLLSAVRYFERFAGWPTLLLAGAAAFGAEVLVADRAAARRLAWGAGAVSATLLVASAGIRAVPGTTSAGHMILENLSDGTLSAGGALALLAIVALLSSRGRLPRLAPAVVAVVVALDLAAVNVRAYVLTPVEAVYPASAAAAPLPRRAAEDPAIGRVTTPYALDADRYTDLLPFESSWRWGARTLSASFHLACRVPSWDVYAGVSPARYLRADRRMGIVGRTVPSGLLGVGAIAVPHRVERAGEAGLPPPWRVLAVDPELPAWLVAIPHRSRAYVAGELVSANADQALEFLAQAVPAREGRTAIEDRVSDGYAPPHGTARIEHDEGERVVVAVESDGRALLVLNDQLLAGWTATVDGRPAPIRAANFLARGVWVEPGRHEVVFRYRTPLWRVSWVVVGAALVALAVPWPRRRRVATAS
jgi:hypothetical protein